jgi:Ca-activated chloride channel homolog
LRKILLLALLIAAPPLCAQDPPLAPLTPPPPPGTNSAPQKEDQRYRIKSNVDLVVLHTTVADDKGQFVHDLKQDNFRVFEDKVEQKISLFSRDDTPVTVGLVIDNSGSMREKRAQVNAAALTFVRTSNPQDEVFVVNFNDEFYLDLNEDFTSDTKELNDALSRIDSRGSTALYDAVIGSLDHLKKGHKDKRVLLVVTDGDDNASRKSFEYTVKAAQESDATIYAIGVFSAEDRQHDKSMVRHSKKDLTLLARATGGLAYFPEDLDQVEAICTQVAHDIRNQYMLGYYPTNTARDGTYRTVQVQLLPPRGLGKLTVRARTGYYAPKSSQSD